jgi:hypothetical protein
VVHAIGRNELPHSGRAHRFEGYLCGGADASFFISDTPLGKGQSLHIHPYAEVLVLRAGHQAVLVARA